MPRKGELKKKMTPTEIGYKTAQTISHSSLVNLPVTEKDIKDYIAGFLKGYEEREA